MMKSCVVDGQHSALRSEASRDTRSDPGVVLADLHGSTHLLERALHLFPGRHLHILGDFVGRGVDQRGTLKLCRELNERGMLSGVMGNHDLCALRWARGIEGGPGWAGKDAGSRGLFQQYGAPGLCPDELSQDALAQVKRDLLWLEHLPYTAVSGSVMLAHGLRPAPEQDEEWVVWARPRSHQLHVLSKGLNASVHGHTAVREPELILDDEGRPALFIDLGSDWRGILGWADLSSGEYGHLT